MFSWPRLNKHRRSGKFKWNFKQLNPQSKLSCVLIIIKYRKSKSKTFENWSQSKLKSWKSGIGFSWFFVSTFNSQAAGWDSWVPTALKSIFWGGTYFWVSCMIFRYYPDFHFYIHFWNQNSQKKILNTKISKLSLKIFVINFKNFLKKIKKVMNGKNYIAK